MAREAMAKNVPMRGSFMVRRSMMASGRLRAAMAIMKARAVPRGMPFSKRTTATGTMAAQLPYMGTPRRVAMGTEKMPVADIMLRMASWGT